MVKIILFLGLMVTSLARAKSLGEELNCAPNAKSCIRNTDCCEGCCFKEKCVSYAENCVKENNPCALHDCPPNKVCYLQQVYCIQAPCPPIPACRPADYDYN